MQMFTEQSNVFSESQTQTICKNWYYYMASSLSGQEVSNPALCLATRSGAILLLGTTRRFPQDKFPRNPLLTRLGQDDWIFGLVPISSHLDITLVR